MVEWTDNVDAVMTAYRDMSRVAVPSPWWMTLEQYDNGLLLLSGKQRGALYAEPTDDGNWKATWWYLPDANDDPEGSDDDPSRRSEEIEWLRLRAYTAIAAGSEGKHNIVTSAWVEYSDHEYGSDVEPVHRAGHNVLAAFTVVLFDEHLRVWIPHLYDAIPDVHFSYAGGVVPFQAFGVWQGHSFYFRYRHGRGSLSLSTRDPVKEPEWQSFAAYGDEMSGYLTWDEFAYLFTVLASRLAPALGWYTFAGETLDKPRSVMAFSEEEARTELGKYGLTAVLLHAPHQSDKVAAVPFRVLGTAPPPDGRVAAL